MTLLPVAAVSISGLLQAQSQDTLPTAATPAEASDLIYFIRSNQIIEPIERPERKRNPDLAIRIDIDREERARDQKILAQAVQNVAVTKGRPIVILDMDAAWFEKPPILLYANPRLDLTGQVRERYTEIRAGH